MTDTVYTIRGPGLTMTTADHDPGEALTEAIEAIGLSWLHGRPVVTPLSATCWRIRYPEGPTFHVGTSDDHEIAAGSLCTPDDTGCCVTCGVAMTVCDACTGIGYHRASCPDSDDFALISHCYFCHGAGGECVCGWPHGVESEDDILFEHEGECIAAPNVSVCTRFYVDPVRYYGSAYTEWVRRENPPLTRERAALITRIRTRCAAEFGGSPERPFFEHDRHTPAESIDCMLVRLFTQEQTLTGDSDDRVIDTLIHG